MAFDYVLPPSNPGEGNYPVGASERFASALQQFVWSCRQHGGEDVRGMSESHTVSLSLSLERAPPSPPLSPPATHLLRALQGVLAAARCSPCDSRTDPVTESGLYLMRLTRLLEQQTLARVQSDLTQCLGDFSSSSRCVSPLSRAQRSSLSNSETVCTDRNDAWHVSNKVHSRGRRYTRHAASSSTSPSPSCVLDRRALLDSSTEIEQGGTSSPMWRYHADLTLQLQQCMLRCMCHLDAAPAQNSANDSGLRGNLTHARAAQLQNVFLNAILHALLETQARWAANTAAPGAAEAGREIAAAVERLQQAAFAKQQHGDASPQLRVYELSATEPLQRSPPPFAAQRVLPSAVFGFQEGYGDFDAVSVAAAPDTHSEIERCLGVAGCDYASKLVAQQLWCAQKTLSQRFPSYAATWDLLDCARSFVASTRSPTPTVPRSDVTERHTSPTAFGAPASPASSTSSVSSPERAQQHDGGTPPPCVTTTQTKRDRPVGPSALTSPPFRNLTYSEERSETLGEAETAVTGATVSPSPRPTASPSIPPRSTPCTQLLPVARCTMWESFLTKRGIPVTSMLTATEDSLADVHLRQPLAQWLPAVGCGARLLQPRSLNSFIGKRGHELRKKTCSIETENCHENRSPMTATRRPHARSS